MLINDMLIEKKHKDKKIKQHGYNYMCLLFAKIYKENFTHLNQDLGSEMQKTGRFADRRESLFGESV